MSASLAEIKEAYREGESDGRYSHMLVCLDTFDMESYFIYVPKGDDPVKHKPDNGDPVDECYRFSLGWHSQSIEHRANHYEYDPAPAEIETITPSTTVGGDVPKIVADPMDVAREAFGIQSKCSCGKCVDDEMSKKPFPLGLTKPMILCVKCGNKRCPKALFHGYECTGSNDVGQKPKLEAGELTRTESKEKAMTNHIEEAKRTIGENSGISEAHALIAIAEQLQLANRISMKVGHFVDTLWDEKEFSRTLKPEIAELLGVEE